MIKKYNYKIAGIASFAGFAINNVKGDNTGDVTIKIYNDSYFSAGIKLSDNKKTSIKDVLGEIKKLGDSLKLNGTNDSDHIDLSKADEEYFIKSIKGNEEGAEKTINFNKANNTCNIKTAKKILIELVPKLGCVEFKYTKNGKQLITYKECELLKSVVQGEGINKIIFTNILKDEEGNAKFGNEIVKSSTKKIGSDVELFNPEKKCIFEIDSSKIEEACETKKVICNFDNDVKLVDWIDLEALYNLNLTDIARDKLDFTVVSNKLKTVKASDGTNSAAFFNDNFGFTVINGNTNVSIKKNENNKKFDDADFIVLDDIKAADINPIFLKKTFKVELDKEGNDAKQIDPKILETIENNLKTGLGDNVVINVGQIIDIIKKSTKPAPSKDSIFKTDAFTNLDNVTIIGVKLSGDKLADGDTVNSAEINISIEEAEFAQDVVTIKLELKVSFNDPKRGNKTLKSNIKGAIENIIKSITTKITKAEFIKKFNDDTTIAKGDSKQFDENDFNFGTTLENTNITKNGTIVITNNFFGKLADSCFEEPKKPEEHKDNQSTSTSTCTGSGDGKKSEKKCCNSGKNQ